MTKQDFINKGFELSVSHFLAPNGKIITYDAATLELPNGIKLVANFTSGINTATVNVLKTGGCVQSVRVRDIQQLNELVKNYE
jgi:hypothetical protein